MRQAWSRLRILSGLGAAIFVSGPQATLAQTLGQGAPAETPLWRVVAAFGLCVALAVAGALVLKAKGTGRLPQSDRLAGFRSLSLKFALTPKARRINIIETVRVSANLELCLFSHDDQDVLIAVAGQTLHVLDRSKAAATTTAQQP